MQRSQSSGGTLLQQLQKATNLALIGKKAARKLKIALGARA
ncbi:MAG: hypothetical protein AB1507_01280 [Bacillota bacterium]|jgi:hypothetical protein|nr:hypothetical protein [Thermoanaerobacteraceae bacterium]